jgi:hypothetical protein
MEKGMHYAYPFPYQDLCIPFSISGLLSSRKTDIGQRTVIIPRDRYRPEGFRRPEGKYRLRDDISPEMEKGMY